MCNPLRKNPKDALYEILRILRGGIHLRSVDLRPRDVPYDLLEAKCNRCDRVSLVPLRALKHPPDTPVWKLEAALYCEPCSEGRHYKPPIAGAYPWADIWAT